MSGHDVDAVWNKGTPIVGMDPKKYRVDNYRNILDRDEYGKDTPLGWEVDHKIPSSRGGSDDIANLQPLQKRVNNKKSNSLVKATKGLKVNKVKKYRGGSFDKINYKA